MRRSLAAKNIDGELHTPPRSRLSLSSEPDMPAFTNVTSMPSPARTASSVTYTSIMKTLQELGEAVTATRRELRLKQKDVAAQAGITPELLLRFERGQVSEFGARKLRLRVVPGSLWSSDRVGKPIDKLIYTSLLLDFCCLIASGAIRSPIGASPMALLSVIGRNMVGRIQVAAAGALLEEPAKPIEVVELLQASKDQNLKRERLC